MNKRQVKLATWRSTENNKQNIKDNRQRLINITVDIILVLIFVWTARVMLKDIFGVGAMNSAGVLLCVIPTVIVSGVMEFLDNVAYGKNKLVKGSIPLMGVLLLCAYLFMFKGGKKILGGMTNFASLFIQKWNVYYRTGIKINESKNGNIELAVGFIIIILILLFVWLGKISRKRLFYSIIPVIVIALEVTVGYAPSKKGFVLMLVGIFLANVLEYERTDFVKVSKESVADSFRRKCVYVVIVGGMIVVSTMCAQKLVSSSVNETLKYSSDVRAIQKSMVEDFSISELLKSISEAIWNKNRDGEVISNMRLSFKNVPVFKMYAESMAMKKMYLKEFYGAEYVGGKWINDGDIFEKDVEEAGFSKKDVKEQISSMGKNSMGEYSYGLNVRFEYLKKNSKVAYVPYFSEISDDISIQGGVYYTKDKKLSEISYKVWESSLEYVDYIYNIKQDVKLEWEEWYEQYVCDEYLSVPSSMSGIKELAYELAVRYDKDWIWLPTELYSRICKFHGLSEFEDKILMKLRVKNTGIQFENSYTQREDGPSK